MAITALGHIDDVLERGTRRALPATISITHEVRRLVDRSRSLETARAARLNIERQCVAFGRIFAEEGLVAELFGRLEVEVHDGGLALQSPALEFSRVSADAAVRWFEQQRIIKRERLGWLKTAFRRKGQLIGRDLQSYVEMRLDESLTDAITQGWSKRRYLNEAGSIFDAWGITRPARHHVETVFETVGQAAYAHGRWEQQRQPHILEARPFWQYKTAGDGRVRPSHEAMANAIYPADDEIWNVWYPPNGFRCRCAVISLAEGEVSARPSEGLLPDPGFAQSPADFLR